MAESSGQIQEVDQLLLEINHIKWAIKLNELNNIKKNVLVQYCREVANITLAIKGLIAYSVFNYDFVYDDMITFEISLTQSSSLQVKENDGVPRHL